MPSKKYSVKADNIKNWFIVLGLTVLFIGCFLLAVITPFAIELHDKVASADSTVGIVENNIITSNFDVNNVVSSTSYTIKDWVNWNGLFSSAVFNPLGYTTLYRGVGSQNSNTSYVFNVTAGLTYTFAVNINNTIFSTSYTFSSIPTSYAAFGQTNIVLDDVVQGYIRFDYRNFCPEGSVSCTICLTNSSTLQSFDVYFAKLEIGSSFTGYVLNDYENYGYNQGYNDGFSFYNEVQNYHLISALNLKSLNSDGSTNLPFVSTKFVLNGTNYDGSWGYYDYDMAGYAGITWTNSSANNRLPGLKFSSSLLYGDIALSIPYYFGEDNRWIFVVESLDDGLFTYIDPLVDTSYFTYYPIYGYTFESDSNVAGTASYYGSTWRYLVFSYFSSSICNIYMIPLYRSFSNGNLIGESLVFYNNGSYLYSTQSLSHLSTFQDGWDSGYQYGFDNGVDSVNLAEKESLAKQEGLTQGRNEGWDSAERFYHVGQYGDGTRFDIQTLLFSVVDSPLQAGFKMFDFEILGYNVRDLLFSFLTIGIILFVIKKFVI